MEKFMERKDSKAMAYTMATLKQYMENAQKIEKE
jgi:hypothetical protein